MFVVFLFVLEAIGGTINCIYYWMNYTLFIRLLTSIYVGISAIVTILIVVSLVGMFTNCIIVYSLVFCVIWQCN